MHLYDCSVGQFIERVTAGQIVDALTRNFRSRLDARPTDSETKSWRESLGAFAETVSGEGLDEAWIVLEYQLPLSSSRLDCMLLGSDQASVKSAVVLEFKQWDRFDACGVPDVVSLGGLEKLHPSAQARAYCRYLAQTHSAFAGGAIRLQGAAYLHNLREDRVRDFAAPDYYTLLSEAPVFTADTARDLGRFVAERTGQGAGRDLVERVLRGGFLPSRRLLENVARSIEGHEPWTLLDEQLVVFKRILADIVRARETGERQVVVVTGGPGTGKSVIAVQVVGAAARQEYAVVHATGSKAFTTNMRAVVGQDGEAIFRYTHNFRDAPPASVDLIVCDEAHRLRQKTQFGPRIYSRRPQAEEIIDAAKVAVFLLDRQQSVRLNETGSVEGIASYAAARGVPVQIYDLNTQFRCAGSESYVRWVEHALGLGAEGSLAWRRNGEYEVKIFDDPTELERAIRARADDGSSARLVAGFCWEWSDPMADGALVPDVRIGNWERPWNRKPAEMLRHGKGAPPVAGEHPYTIWATRPEGMEEVGCIYSAQGFEFDYVGVIFGKDLRWDRRQGRWRSDLDMNCDTSFKRGLRRDETLAVQQLGHVYRVLSTRGMKGTYFYFLDSDTRARFGELLGDA